MLNNLLDTIQSSWQLFLRSFDRIAASFTDPHILSSFLSGIPLVIATIGLIGALFCVITKAKNQRLLFELSLLYLFGVVISLLNATSGQVSHDLIFSENPIFEEAILGDISFQKNMTSWQWIPMLLPILCLLPLLIFKKAKKIRMLLQILVFIFPICTFIYASSTALSGYSLRHDELGGLYQLSKTKTSGQKYTFAQALGLEPLKQEKSQAELDREKAVREAPVTEEEKGLMQIGEALKNKAGQQQGSEDKSAPQKPKQKPRGQPIPPAGGGGGGGIFDF